MHVGKRKSRGRRPGGPGGRYVTGTRLVALFEAAKGVVVIVAGLGMLALVHRHAQAVVEEIGRFLV